MDALFMRGICSDAHTSTRRVVMSNDNQIRYGCEQLSAAVLLWTRHGEFRMQISSNQL